MYETVTGLYMQMGSSALSTNEKKKLRCKNPTKVFAKCDECAGLVRSGTKTSLTTLQALLPCLLSRNSKYFLFGGTDDISWQLVDRLQEDELRSLCRFLIEKFETLKMSPAMSRSTKL